MHDSARRCTLKLLAATGASAVLPTSLLSANVATQLTGASQIPTAATRTPDLYIDLISSAAVPDDSVVIKNTTRETIVVNKFLPNNVVFDEVQIDLNAAAGDKPLVIKPNQIISLRTKALPLQRDDEFEYVWANSATQEISNDLTTVQLGVFMVNNQAVVYPFNAPTSQTAFPV